MVGMRDRAITHTPIIKTKTMDRRVGSGGAFSAKHEKLVLRLSSRAA